MARHDSRSDAKDMFILSMMNLSKSDGRDGDVLGRLQDAVESYMDEMKYWNRVEGI